MRKELDGSLSHPPGAWNEARNEWPQERASATGAVIAHFTGMIAGSECQIEKTFDLLSFAAVNCTDAEAEALWASGTVECLDFDALVPGTDDATGKEVRNGHRLAPFIPNNRIVNPNHTARWGYRDAAGLFAVQLEGLAPHTLSHAGFTTQWYDHEGPRCRSVYPRWRDYAMHGRTGPDPELGPRQRPPRLVHADIAGRLGGQWSGCSLVRTCAQRPGNAL